MDTIGDWILDNGFGPSYIIKSSRILKSNHVRERFQISNRWIDHQKRQNLQIDATVSPCWMLILLDLSVWKSSWSRSWKLTGHEETHQKCAVKKKLLPIGSKLLTLKHWMIWKTEYLQRWEEDRGKWPKCFGQGRFRCPAHGSSLQRTAM